MMKNATDAESVQLHVMKVQSGWSMERQNC